MPNYWLGIAVGDYIQLGVDGGYAQLSNGRINEISALQKGDWLIYYANKKSTFQATFIQRFVALGQVTSDAPYGVEINESLTQYRHDMDYVEGAEPVSIRPLLPQLSFTSRLGRRWGMALRRNILSLSEEDFKVIAAAMNANISDKLT